MNIAVEKKKGVKPLSSALKIFALLDLIARQKTAVRLVDLTRLTGESKGTVYQRLVTLMEVGWIEQSDPGSYRLALRAAMIGDMALEQSNLGERATATLEQLALECKETVSLAVLDGVKARLIRRVEAEVVVRAEVRIGTTLQLASSSSGRILTAFATPEIRRLLELKGATLATEDILNQVRTSGYAVSTGEDILGVRSIAMPIFFGNRGCVAALSIVTPVERFNSERLLPLLRIAAEALNATMLSPDRREAGADG
ncbi:MAG: IclR family transcriptional regulator [Thermomicrobiales bacterium]